MTKHACARRAELALMNNDPRSADVVAVGPCTTLVIQKKDFAQLLGPCQARMKQQEQEQARPAVRYP